jgi:hypothetical protein
MAGRTLVAERSSKGNGTSTTLPFVIEWLPVGQGIDILLRVVQEIESRVDRRRV